MLGRDVTLHEFTSSEDGVFFLMTRKGEERIAFLDKELELYVIDTPSNLYFSSLSHGWIKTKREKCQDMER